MPLLFFLGGGEGALKLCKPFFFVAGPVALGREERPFGLSATWIDISCIGIMQILPWDRGTQAGAGGSGFHPLEKKNWIRIRLLRKNWIRIPTSRKNWTRIRPSWIKLIRILLLKKNWIQILHSKKALSRSCPRKNTGFGSSSRKKNPDSFPKKNLTWILPLKKTGPRNLSRKYYPNPALKKCSLVSAYVDWSAHCVLRYHPIHVACSLVSAYVDWSAHCVLRYHPI